MAHKCSRRQWFAVDTAFMGYTHAISVLGVGLILLAFASDVMRSILMTSNVWALALFVITAVGAGNIPDLDNTASRAKSDLGIFGGLISGIFRTTSTIIQTTVRTKRDSADPNPHRGAWHTLPACALLGFLIYLSTTVGGSIEVPVIGKTTWGTVLALLFSVVLTHLALSTLAKEAMDKVKKSAIVGEFAAVIVSVVLTTTVFVMAPHDKGYWWLGVATAFGMAVHIIGDCFTTAGAPILFPLSGFIKGKFWWTTRFLPIKAGGPFENYVFVPVFTLMAFVGIGKMALDLWVN